MSEYLRSNSYSDNKDTGYRYPEGQRLSYLRIGNIWEPGVVEEPLLFALSETDSARKQFGFQYLTLANEYINRLRTVSFVPNSLEQLRDDIAGRILRQLVNTATGDGRQLADVPWKKSPLDMGQPILKTDLTENMRSLKDALLSDTLVFFDDRDVRRAYSMNLVRAVFPSMEDIIGFMQTEQTIAVLSEQNLNGLNSQRGTFALWKYYLGI